MQGSQYGEDRILNMVFKGQDTGFLVDVGAADGITHSNSWMLLQRPGWSGILVEPEPSHFAQVAVRYKDRQGVTCVNAAVGPQEEMGTLYCAGQASTIKTARKKICEDGYGITFTGVASVQVVPLTTLLLRFGAQKEIDFLSIDAEGMDYQVWQTLDLNQFSPKLVCIEGKGYVMHGYREFCLTRGNTLYLREDLCDPLDP